MAKHQRHAQTREASTQPPAQHHVQPQGAPWLGLATLVGVMALLMISFSNWREIDDIEESLDERLSSIESRLAQVSEKVDALPAQAQAAQPPRRGPDPNRVYQIKTDGRPSKGPAKAAVTIAEFSDFQ